MLEKLNGILENRGCVCGGNVDPTVSCAKLKRSQSFKATVECPGCQLQISVTKHMPGEEGDVVEFISDLCASAVEEWSKSLIPKYSVAEKAILKRFGSGHGNPCVICKHAEAPGHFGVCSSCTRDSDLFDEDGVRIRWESFQLDETLIELFEEDGVFVRG